MISWTVPKHIKSLIDEKFDFDDADMQSHTKMTAGRAFEVLNMTLLRSKNKAQRNRVDGDYFGDESNITLETLLKAVKKLLGSKSGWHNGAVASHLLAMAGSKYYRR